MPVPVPELVTVNDTVGGTLLNVAVTAPSALNITLQISVPEQPPPLHPAKVEPIEAVGVRLTTVPPE